MSETMASEEVNDNSTAQEIPLQESQPKEQPHQDQFNEFNEQEQQQQQPEEAAKPANGFGNDDIPIGQKSKFNIQEFPDDEVNDLPVRKPVTKKNNGASTKLQIVPKRASEINESPTKPIQILDEVPVGGGKRLNISEYPDDEGPPQEDGGGASKLPLAQRVKSKVWKLRQSAFEEMAEKFESEGNEAMDEFYEEWPKFLNDSNPGSQEKALVTFKVFLDKCDPKQLQSRLDCVEVVKVLVDKCISPGKPQIKKLAYDILCDLFEKRDKQQIYESLKQLLTNKNAKVQAAAISSIIELLLNFGPKPLDYLKPFFGEIEKQAASTNSTVRQECMNFYKEAFKWLGENVLAPFIKNLKKAQLDEIDKFKEEWEAHPMIPLRGGATVTVQQGGGSMADAYDIVDAVDIFSKYNEKWCDKVLALGKWNEKTAMIEEMIKVASAPKLNPSQNYAPYLSFFKKLLAEPNVNVNLVCVKLIGNLVKGLRKHFAGPAKVLFSQLMIKLREKKPQLVDETRNTLDCFFYSLGVEDVLDDLKEGLNDKTSQLKVQVMQFIAKNQECRQQVQFSKQKNTDAMKQLVPIIKKLLDDGVPEVRESALTCLGKLKPYLPESVVSQLCDINSAKLQRVNEIALSSNKLEDSTVLSQSVKKQVKEEKIEKKEQPQQQQQLQQQLQQSQVMTKKPPIASSSKPQPIKLEPEVEVSPEDAESKLRDQGLPNEIFQGMDGNVKDKIQAIHELQDYADVLQSSFDLVLHYLKKKTKDWKESNLQLNKELFALCMYANDLDPKPFGKKVYQPFCRFLVEKMGDAKFKEDVNTLFEGMSSTIQPQYVILMLIQCAQPKVDKATEKSIAVPPKTISEIILQISRIVNLVSVKFIPLSEVLEFTKENIAQTNATIKQSAMELMKTLYKHLGTDLINLIQDIPPQTLKTLSQEFEKVQVLSAAERGRCQIQFQGEAAVQAMAVSTVNPLDQLPRSDISATCQSVLKKLTDPAWQKKKEGLEELDKLITGTGNRVSMNGLGELITQLKQNLTDKNKSVVRPLLNTVGRLAEACGKDFKNLGRQLICPVVQILSDKQQLVRSDVLQTLDKFAISMGAETVIQTFPQFLVLESPEMKLELLNYIIKYQETFPKSDIKNFIQPLLNCVCDRSKEIREKTEQIIHQAVECVGVEPFNMAMKDLKPAVIQSIKPILSKYLGPQQQEDDKKRQQLNRTPKKGGMNSTQPIDTKNLKRNQTAKELNTALDSSLNGSQYESRQRTPGKSQQRKILPTDIIQPTHSIKPVFLEGGLLATSHSTRELKSQRMSQPNLLNNWTQETFIESCVSETLNDLRLCLKPELSNQLLSFDYKQIVSGIKLLSQVCNDSVAKLNVIEVSDLIFKWVILRIYGKSANEITLQTINQFLGIFMLTLEKTGYQLSDLEVSLGIKIMRELIYAQQKVDERFITTFIKIGGPDKILRLWLRLIQLDHSKVHKFVDQQFVERDLFMIVKVYMINMFKEETLSELAKFPQLQKYPDLVQELQRTYDLVAKRVGIVVLDPTSVASQKLNPPQRQTIQLQPNSPRTLQFKQCLNQLLSPQVATKIESLMQINDLIQQCDPNNPGFPMYLFVNNAPNICTCFHSLLTWSFMPGEQVPPQYKQFLLQALQKLYQLQMFVRALPYEPLCTFTEDLLLRLLHEDENKNQHDQGDQIVKQLNSTTLRILENTDPDMIFAILLDLLIKHRRKQQQQSQSKMINLLVKCIIRITKTLEKCVFQIKVDMLLLKFHNYMVEFSSLPNFPNDDVGQKTIKTILIELVKYLGDRIWEPYQIIQQSDVPDQHIGPCLRMLIASNPNQIISPRQRLSSTKNENDSELRMISEMLKRPDQYDQGIRTLLELIKKNPQLNWQRYTVDCPKNVQIYIQQQIDRMSIQRQQPIQQLPLANNSNFQSNLPELNPSALEQRVNMLHQRVSEEHQMRISNVPTITQPQQLRTPEYLMQRLNDMKNKVQTLVGTPQPIKHNDN